VEQQVREGHRVGEAMREAHVFPTTLIHMVSVGEETGDLPEMLTQVSDALDFEVDEGMQRATAIIEPAIILIMGIFIGFVVVSILMPIYQAQAAVGRVR
jgi:type II secretory pathway component PulF